MTPPMHSEAPSATQPEAAAVKACEECGASLKLAGRGSSWQRFCSPDCRNEWHRKAKLGPDGRFRELEQAVRQLRAEVEALKRAAGG